MIELLPGKHVVLLGIGHTNAHVLRMWGMNRFPDADLTCISDFPVATYSGMLPAVLAGQTSKEGMEIDLVRLCASVGARLITDPVIGIDHPKQELLFDNRPSIPFDVLSIGIGSVPTTSGLQAGCDDVIKIKPMQTFLNRLSDRIDQRVQRDNQSPLKVMVVGGGVASIELSFCLPPFIRSVTNLDHTLDLVTRSDQVLPDVAASTRRRVVDGLQGSGVTITVNRSVVAVEPGKVIFDDHTTVDADLVIWATGAVAPDALHRFGLPLDDRGFIATDRSLQTTSGHPVFAVGDTGSIVDDAIPKAGVYAVRQGPVLWENIGRLLQGRTLQTYVPQRSFLKLINQGDGTAIGQWKGWSFSGEWAMRLKDRIDTRFMKMFRPAPMMNDGDQPMQCTGCGCKLGGDLLESALASDPEAAIKLEDAAEIGGDPDYPLIASTDFFTSPLADAFLSGRVAALHSASDIIATGAVATQALANVVVPEGDGRSQKRLLADFLSGSRLEFEEMGASIVGGHTIVGPRMEIGFTVIGKPLGPSLIRKENLRPGDQLFLTKPIGIGILLAAHMRSLCTAEHYQSLVDAMLMRQHDLASIAVDCDINAGTDVTGFGLAGHLLEMLETSDVSAHVRLDSVPLLPGTEKYVKQGVESSLAPDNKRVQCKISSSPAIQQSAAFQAMFDPQTCGGLLLGVASDKCDRFLQAMSGGGHAKPACIGTVLPMENDTDRLKVD